VHNLLTIFKVPKGQYEMGKTKVFFKPGAAVLLPASAVPVAWTGRLG